MSASGSYRTASGKSVVQLLHQLGDHAVVDLGAELYAEGQGVISMAQGLVPVDTGALRASGYTAEPERIGDTVRVEMGFGGAAAPYALIVHEDLNAYHKVGESLFLQTAFNMAKTGMSERIARGLRARLMGHAAAQPRSGAADADV